MPAMIGTETAPHASAPAAPSCPPRPCDRRVGPGTRPLELVASEDIQPQENDGEVDSGTMSSEEGTIDEEAFRLVVEEAKPRMCGYLARRHVPIEDAEDLIQDVLLRFFEKWSTIEIPLHWLMGSLSLAFRMYCRGRSRRFVHTVEDTILEVLAESSEPGQENALLRDNLNRLIGKLKYQCRRLLKLHYGLGYDARETAEALGYKRSSIDNVRKRCLREVARKLDLAARGLMPLKEGPA